MFEPGTAPGQIRVDRTVDGGPEEIAVGRWTVGLAIVHTSDLGTCIAPSCESPFFPSYGEIKCVREFEVTSETRTVAIVADFGPPCEIGIELDPAPPITERIVPIPRWDAPEGGVLDDCHSRKVLLRFDRDGRPWYEDVESGERIEIGPLEFKGASVRIGDVYTVILPDGSEGVSEWFLTDLGACVQYAGDIAWIGPYLAWDPWERALGEQAVHAAQAALEAVRSHYGGALPASITLTSSTVVAPDRAALRSVDAEIRDHGRDRWSTALPWFYIVGPYGGPGSFGEAIGSIGGISRRGEWHWFVLSDDGHRPTEANGVVARGSKQFKTPAGNEVWTLDQTLTVWEDCSKLVMPPITPRPIEPAYESGTDPEGGLALIYVDDADRNGLTLVVVDYTDERCRTHPVAGPIIDHLLEDT